MSEISLTTRTAIVTGAGGGLGRAEALALAESGANVVVNDYSESAQVVADEITAAGGKAIAVRGDVGEWGLGERLVEAALDSFGSLDVVVNNAGVLRDAMIFNLTETAWDDVLRVHLKGHASLTKAAAAHWRTASKAAGGPVYGRLINTASEAFLFGSPGQPNYAAAKAGIVALTLSASRGLARYGITANAIAPRARTSMTDQVFGADPDSSRDLDIMAPERVGTFVSFLASPAAAEINGQVFVVYGDMVALLEPPKVEQKFTAASGTFSVEELAGQISPYFSDRPANKTFAAFSVASLDTTGVGTGG